MTRDYTKVPGYEDMTRPQARYNYLHDLMDWYQGLTKEDRDRFERCKVLEDRKDCRYCSFSGFLGGDPGVCCAWRAEAQPDKAIEILEMLLGRSGKMKDTASEKEDSLLERGYKIRTITDHYSAASQLGMAQEECAELIQAISKVNRTHASPDALEHMAEEIADVQIMCAQLTAYFPEMATHVNRKIDEKLDRQLERIRQGDTAYETTAE